MSDTKQAAPKSCKRAQPKKRARFNCVPMSTDLVSIVSENIDIYLRTERKRQTSNVHKLQTPLTNSTGIGISWLIPLITNFKMQALNGWYMYENRHRKTTVSVPVLLVDTVTFTS